ncbi:MAG: hypothetical protein ACRERV_08160, partial [Methylococcales bacterium]
PEPCWIFTGAGKNIAYETLLLNLMAVRPRVAPINIAEQVGAASFDTRSVHPLPSVAGFRHFGRVVGAVTRGFPALGGLSRSSFQPMVIKR